MIGITSNDVLIGATAMGFCALILPERLKFPTWCASVVVIAILAIWQAT